MKGFVSILEMVTVTILLFIAFQFFFPGFSYESRWSEALLILKARDIILTSDRIGHLYEHSFDSTSLSTFLDTLVPTNETSILSWSETEGNIKNTITIACNCTKEQRENLARWLDALKVNNREINFYILDTRLDVINTPPFLGSDVLLIWGYKDLSSYKSQLLEYLNEGKGVVEMMNFTNNPEDIQNEIFGITSEGVPNPDVDYDVIPKPSTANNITYQPYKIFYHVPFSAKSPTPSSFIPFEKLESIPTCSRNTTGNITLTKVYNFWICNERYACFDTNANGTVDTIVEEGDSFTLENHNFLLSYINNNETIGVAFNPPYNFSDFCRGTNVKPVDNENYRAFMYAIKKLGWGDDIRAFCSILNGTDVMRTVWVIDFTGDLAKVSDDKKQILISLLLWASNKGKVSVLSPNLKIGYLTSYINVNNTDMYEVYRFNLGMGYPF